VSLLCTKGSTLSPRNEMTQLLYCHGSVPPIHITKLHWRFQNWRSILNWNFRGVHGQVNTMIHKFWNLKNKFLKTFNMAISKAFEIWNFLIFIFIMVEVVKVLQYSLSFISTNLRLHAHVHYLSFTIN
jgi:hypothetical protein